MMEGGLHLQAVDEVPGDPTQVGAGELCDEVGSGGVHTPTDGLKDPGEERTRLGRRMDIVHVLHGTPPIDQREGS